MANGQRILARTRKFELGFRNFLRGFEDTRRDREGSRARPQVGFRNRTMNELPTAISGSRVWFKNKFQMDLSSDALRYLNSEVKTRARMNRTCDVTNGFGRSGLLAQVQCRVTPPHSPNFVHPKLRIIFLIMFYITSHYLRGGPQNLLSHFFQPELCYHTTI